MICYMITPILYQKKEKLLKHSKIILVIIAALAVGFSYIKEDVGRTFMYLLLYISAYVYRNNKTDKQSSKIWLILLIMELFAVRIVARKFWDGTVLYNTIVVCLTQILLAYHIYWLLNEIFKDIKIEDNALVNHLDTISYYVYITHMMFMIGPVRTMGMTENMFINSVVTIGLAWITGVLLYRISKGIMRGSI